jgi:hypothetical protein
MPAARDDPPSSSWKPQVDAAPHLIDASLPVSAAHCQIKANL